jgi:hypothetical protein
VRGFLRLGARGEPLLLAALSLGVIGLIYIELDRPALDHSANAAMRPTKPTAPETADGLSFVMPPLVSFAEVVNRPLFSQTRRPAPKALAPGNEQSLPYTLVGVVITAHERHALIAHGTPPRLERLTEGQDLEGWTIEQILADRLVFGRDGARIEVKAKDPPSQPGPPRPAGAAIIPPPSAPFLAPPRAGE